MQNLLYPIFLQGFTYTILFGSLSLMSFGKKIKSSLIIQFIGTIGYFVLSYIFEYVFIYANKLDFRSALLSADILSAVFILGFAVLVNKGFQQLITPKKIS